MTKQDNDVNQLEYQLFQFSTRFEEMRCAYVALQALVTASDVEASHCYPLLEVLNFRFDGVIADFDALRGQLKSGVKMSLVNGGKK